MGIAVVTSTPVVASSNTAAGLVPSGDPGIDFAALLLQLANPAAAEPLAAALPSATGDDKSAPAAQDAGVPFDPSGLLPALLAGALPVPPSLPAQQASAPTAEADGLDPLAARNPSAPRAGLAPPASGETRATEARMATPETAAPEIGSSRPAPASPRSAPDINALPAARGETANIAAEPLAAANPAGFADQLAAQVAAAPHPQRQDGAAAAAPLQIGAPLHDPKWSHDLGDKVVWLAKSDLQSAQISINPPQLGPMQITLNVSGDQASALFISPHAEVRQAIQDAMPQLREMLAGAGINLGEANVGAQLPRQDPGTPQRSANPSRSDSDEAILHADNGLGATSLPRTRGGRGMVDLFA